MKTSLKIIPAEINQYAGFMTCKEEALHFLLDLSNWQELGNWADVTQTLVKQRGNHHSFGIWYFPNSSLTMCMCRMWYLQARARSPKQHRGRQAVFGLLLGARRRAASTLALQMCSSTLCGTACCCSLMIRGTYVS